MRMLKCSCVEIVLSIILGVAGGLLAYAGLLGSIVGSWLVFGISALFFVLLYISAAFGENSGERGFVIHGVPLAVGAIGTMIFSLIQFSIIGASVIVSAVFGGIIVFFFALAVIEMIELVIYLIRDRN